MELEGQLSYYVLPSNKEDLIEVVKLAKEHKEVVTIIGSGSNLLISDEGLREL